jgi:hypothetical protein
VKTFSGTGLIFLLTPLLVLAAEADGCPSAMDVRYRLISETYEWTVDEGITLEDVISVTRLFAVSIENHGEYVSCKYEYDKRFLKLDGAPKKNNCRITFSSGKWLDAGNGKLICDEEDVTQCNFKVEC